MSVLLITTWAAVIEFVPDHAITNGVGGLHQNRDHDPKLSFLSLILSFHLAHRRAKSTSVTTEVLLRKVKTTETQKEKKIGALSTVKIVQWF